MNQRTCSHRISELYNEIILNDKFKEEYTILESFYKDNIYVTIFNDNGFKVKLLITDKENQNIIFENICNESFIINNNIKEDLFLYSVDIKYSLINKIKNPIFNTGLIEDSINKKHQFISLSKEINDILFKDDLLYFSVKINGIIVENDKNISIELTKRNNYLTAIDKISDEFVFEDISLLIGLNSNDLKEIDRDSFFDAPSIIIVDKKINRKNSILIKVYDGYFMENITFFIDYSQGITKQLHPPYLVNSNKKYLLVLPYLGYNTYSDFKLIRLRDLKEVDLDKILTKEEMYQISIIVEDILNTTAIRFNGDDILLIGDYEFSCDNLFNINSKTKNQIKSKGTELRNLIPIESHNFSGYALDIHTIKSTLLSNGQFETTRTEIGELLYRLKYKFDKSAIREIASKCSEVIISVFANIDVIIPVPPSNLERYFQPVYEVAKKIEEQTKIPVDFDYIIKLPTEQIKTLNNEQERIKILDSAIAIKDDRYKNKNILIFDDLFRSGDTVNVLSKKLLKDGKIKSVSVLCITKTRTKR